MRDLQAGRVEDKVVIEDDVQIQDPGAETDASHLPAGRVFNLLEPEQQVLRGTAVGMLSFAKQPEAATQFMDFLASAESRAFYKEYGWEIPSN